MRYAGIDRKTEGVTGKWWVRRWTVTVHAVRMVWFRRRVEALNNTNSKANRERTVTSEGQCERMTQGGEYFAGSLVVNHVPHAQNANGIHLK